PIYLDSPMAVAANRADFRGAGVFHKNFRGLPTSRQLKSDLPPLVISQSSDESRALNSVTRPRLLLAGAGMCNAGRILHHLRHNLWNSNCFVIIVGYQARGSLGRSLVEGAKKVKIFGETVAVRAQIKLLGGFSAHAGQCDLIRWLEPM